MGLLDKLWDDTVAGPPPETGLSRLRKHSSFPLPRSAVKDERSDGEEAARVTRSIMIKRPAGCPSPANGTPPAPLAGCPSPANGTPPASPAGSTPPLSPFSGKESNRFRRKSMSDAFERGAGVGGTAVVGRRGPTLSHEV